MAVRSPLVAGVLCAALSLLLSACGASSGAEKSAPGRAMPPAQVDVVTVTPRSLPEVFEYVGRTTGSREVEVRARVTGILLKRNFKEGAPVKRGESLFTIDPEPFKVALARAEADLTAAEARHEMARRNAARFRPLYAEKAVSQKDFDDAVSAEEISAADVAAARARLKEARLNLSYTRVEAPVSGIADRAQRSEGSLVSGPDVLLTRVTQVDPIWVNFGIPDNEEAALRSDIASGALVLPEDGGFEVALRLSDGSIYPKTGRLNFSAVRINPATGTREARAELPNADGALRPGQFVRVILKGATRPHALTVPQRAVLEGPKGKFVYVVGAAGKAEARPVVVGEWSGGDWIISSGLADGDRVIVDGVMKLRPGAPVKVAQSG